MKNDFFFSSSMGNIKRNLSKVEFHRIRYVLLALFKTQTKFLLRVTSHYLF